MNASKVTFRNEAAERGKVLFFRTDSENGTLSAGKCSTCHNNFGGNVDPAFFAMGDADLEARIGLRANANFDTGVEIEPTSIGLREELGIAKDGGFGVVPLDAGCNEAEVRGGMPPGGFGAIVQPDSLAVAIGLARAGDCLSAFNTPPLIESLDTQPFFHNGILTDIEEVPEFYASDAFTNSDAGIFFASRDSAAKAIPLEEEDIDDIGVALRIVGGDENLAQMDELVAGALSPRAQESPEAIGPLLNQALQDLEDFFIVAGGLQDDVDEVVNTISEGLMGAIEMDPASPEQRDALAQVREDIARARGLFFEDGASLYTEEMPRVPERE